MSGIASAALDAQLAELRWTRTTLGTTYLDTVAEAAFQGKATPSTGGKKLIETMLVLGETFGVTSEITDVIESMAPSMPNYTLHESDLPSPCGFIHLERPVVFVDRRNMPIVVKNLMWGKTEVIAPNHDKRKWGVTLVLLTDPSDVRDHMHDQYVQEKFDRLVWPTSGMAMFGGIWLVGQSFDGMTNTQSSLLRFFAAFLRFVQEKWVDSREIIPERAVIKRSNRLRKIEPKIRVVRLRQAEHKVRRLPSGETIEWSHRWVVERHWRKQWYPSLQCHKPIAIESYIKGPPDKPLVVNDRIFVVDR